MTTKITTYIDGALLNKAVRALGARSKREALEGGLRAVLAEVRRKTFVREFDRIRLRLSPHELADLRR